MNTPTGQEPWWYLLYAMVLMPVGGFFAVKVWPWVTARADAGRTAAMKRDEQLIKMLVDRLDRMDALLERQIAAIDNLARAVSDLRVDVAVENKVLAQQGKHDAEIERLLNMMSSQMNAMRTEAAG